MLRQDALTVGIDLHLPAAFVAGALEPQIEAPDTGE